MIFGELIQLTGSYRDDCRVALRGATMLKLPKPRVVRTSKSGSHVVACRTISWIPSVSVTADSDRSESNLYDAPHRWIPPDDC